MSNQPTTNTVSGQPLFNLVFCVSFVVNPDAVVWLFVQYCTEQLIAT
jgi:hypothetical protein